MVSEAASLARSAIGVDVAGLRLGSGSGDRAATFYEIFMRTIVLIANTALTSAAG